MDKNPTRYEALIACRDAAGSDSQLARDLNVPQPTMWRWLNQSKQLPAEYVLQAERLYGVSRHHLRPDIYPVEHSPGSVHPHAFMGVDRGQGRVSFQGQAGLKGEAASCSPTA